MAYGIGLDCGIASVGFAAVELNQNDEPCRIIKLGSRIFDKAEHPKDGSSLAAPRREARGARRRLRRHKHRLQRIRHLLVSEGIVTENELESIYSGVLEDIYALRVRALEERLSNAELARVLINLAQRRGFKSNRKSDSSDKEAGLLLKAVEENRLIMEKKQYRTIGEMFLKDEKYSEHKRNKGEGYSNTVSRDMVEDEMHKIFEAQRNFKNNIASEELEERYIDIALSQRPFDLGPGKGSPYAGDQIAKMIGACTLLPQEQRAVRASYSFQLFTLWQAINNLRLYSDSETRVLTDAERIELFRLCHKSPSVTYDKIKKQLSLDGYTFKNLSYGSKDIEEVEKKSKFEYLKFYHQIRKALDKFKKDYILSLSTQELNAIGYAFTVYKNDEQIVNCLRENDIDEILYPYLLTLGSFSKTGHISVKVCDMLIPYLEKGLTYDKACEAAGLEFKAHGSGEKSKLLSLNSDELNDIANPVVRRAVSQTIKVINSIIREQGESPVYINIELARELSKSFSERKDIEAQMKKNEERNQGVIKRLKEDYGRTNPTGMDIVKLKLCEEQGEICPYSQKRIELDRIFDIGYVEVDHIIPYSISFDDSYNNKVLVLTAENQQKGNRLPMQYLSGKKKEKFQVWVNNYVRNFRKKKNLLKETISDEDINGFKDRNLNDTRYLSKLLYNYINDNLEFSPFQKKNRVKHVVAVNGAATAYVRKRWGISKIREDGDLHHAVDAAVIAVFTQGLVQKVSRYSQHREIEYSGFNGECSYAVDTETGEAIDKFPLPYPAFGKELEIRMLENPKREMQNVRLANYTPVDINNIKPCFVSRMPNHKATGAAHEDTIRSGKEDGFKISKVPLSSLSLDKDGEIKNYYNCKDDMLLYNALKARLSEFGGDGAKAFPQGSVFHKPKSDGSDGPIVKKVKIIEKSSLNVQVRNEYGIADNGSMVRIDVFFVPGEGYYFVPIYVADTVGDLPNKACVAHKPYSEWKEMKDENFVFSLYNNDLVKVTSKKGIKLSLINKNSTLPNERLENEAMFYYKGADISGGCITFENNDGSYKARSIGIKSLVKIEKYTVDPIGNYFAVGKEKRMRFN